MIKKKTQAGKKTSQSLPTAKTEQPETPEVTYSDWVETFNHQGRFNYQVILLLQDIAIELREMSKTMRERNEILKEEIALEDSDGEEDTEDEED